MPMSVDAGTSTLYTRRTTSQGLGRACIRQYEEAGLRVLVCGCWSAVLVWGYAGALCAGGLLIPLSPTATGT